jgi:hypothetical protein
VVLVSTNVTIAATTITQKAKRTFARPMVMDSTSLVRDFLCLFSVAPRLPARYRIPAYASGDAAGGGSLSSGGLTLNSTRRFLA